MSCGSRFQIKCEKEIYRYFEFILFLMNKYLKFKKKQFTFAITIFTDLVNERHSYTGPNNIYQNVDNESMKLNN